MKIPLKNLFAAILALVLFNSAYAENKSAARIGREEIIAAEGMKIKLFKDAIPKPIPPVTVEKLQSSNGEKVEAYAPEDLWVHDQYVGSWGCDEGMISIFKITLPAPADLKRVFRNLVLKSDYDKWKEEKSPDWNGKAVADWIKFFSGGKVKNTDGEAIQKDIPKKNRITCYYYDDVSGKSRRRLYIAECADRPNDKYLIVYDLSPEAVTVKSEEAINQSLQSISFFTPKPAEAKPLTPAKAAAKGRDYSQAYLESREKVIQSIRSLKGWKYFETENFILVTNMENRKTIADLQANLEKCGSVYRKYYPQEVPLREVSVCKVFETRDEYLSYVSENLKWSTGVWMADKRELVISPPVRNGTTSEKRETILGTLLHEAFHQYIFYAADETQSAIWFNEGNACYFQGIEFTGGDRTKIELTRLYEPMKKLAVSGNIRIEPLIIMGSAEFYEGKEVNYTLAWGLMFFLQKGAAILKRKNNYSEIPSKYYDALIETKDGRKATKIAWAGVDMEKISKDFVDFWRNDALIRRAEAFDPLEVRGRNTNR